MYEMGERQGKKYSNTEERARETEKQKESFLVKVRSKGIKALYSNISIQ